MHDLVLWEQILLISSIGLLVSAVSAASIPTAEEESFGQVSLPKMARFHS